MKKIKIGFLFPLMGMILLIAALSQQLFSIPPMGKLLNPFSGAVRNGESKHKKNVIKLEEEGLKAAVNIYFDQRSVPHIYAKNSDDMYFAQGYIAAQFRLWQMDFISDAAAGRLSEILGSRFLEYDRNQRRIGILFAAEASLKMIEKDSETLAALTAYSKGVNAYIKKLDYKNTPVEYKIMDYKPEEWSNLKTVLIMKNLTSTLTGYDDDLSMSGMMMALGEENFNKLYPSYFGPITPVMGEQKKVVNPDLVFTKKPDYLNFGFMAAGTTVNPSAYNPKLGSNSWAVSGSKTKSGFPILCSDPHLNLSLPAVWMEMQLNCPGTNVYGVSIPGTPAVIIGFNEDIAWGITNGADDVKDWYKLKITNDYKNYEMDGKWRKLESTVVEIKRKNQSSFYDTIYRAPQGPVVYDKSFAGNQGGLKNSALKWELHRPSNEFGTFIKLNKAKRYSDYKNAIANFSSPIQNFTFACKDNTIAINHQGKLARREAAEGRFILDGTRSRLLKRGYIPVDSLPGLLNPSSNYVLSANQHPTGKDYPYYYSGYYSEIRANRIQQLLASHNDLDIKDMEAIQLDNVNKFSLDALPILLDHVDLRGLNKDQLHKISTLHSWKGTYDFNDFNALLFEFWWKNIKEVAWEELKIFPFYTKVPDDYVLLNMIKNSPEGKYFYTPVSGKKENTTKIITGALIKAIATYNGNKNNSKWGAYNKINIMHLSNMDAFSKMNISSSGHPEAINAISKNWGPSWRMIVELGDRPKAYGIYPGGQSGNIGSPNYDDFLTDWTKGKYYELNFYMSQEEAQKHTNK